MLYELLTGTTPFASDSLKKVGPDEMRRIIREVEPPPPSRRLSTLSVQACSTASERRGADGRRLGQVLRGELDWIVMRALEKDRDRRYESASAFAADVQRYLNDETVEACPPSAGYRLRKYVRRNGRVLVPLAVIAMVLVAATTVSSWLAVHALDAQHQAEADRDLAAAAEKRSGIDSEIARAVNEFLQQDLLRQVDSDPQFRDQSTGNTKLTVKEALDRAGAKIADRFKDKPLVEAAIRTAIAESYESLDERPPAAAHLERAFELYRTQAGPEHPDTVASMQRLASAFAWEARHQEAIALGQRVLEIQQSRFGHDHRNTLAIMTALARVYHQAGQPDKSVVLCEQALNIQRAILGSANRDTQGTMHQLARSYMEVGRFAESMALHEELLVSLRSANGPEHESTLWPMLTFAQACQRAGQLDRAEQLLREWLEHFGKRESSRSWRASRGRALGWLARTLFMKGQCVEAESLARKAVEITEEEQPNDPSRFYWGSLLGAILLGQQRYAEAEPLLLQGYETLMKGEAVYHVEKFRVIEAGDWIVRFYYKTNQPEKAREWREKISVRAETKTPPKTKEAKPE
jgi:tetratricopeptide (TPR) repeat protein